MRESAILQATQICLVFLVWASKKSVGLWKEAHVTDWLLRGRQMLWGVLCIQRQAGGVVAGEPALQMLLSET